MDSRFLSSKEVLNRLLDEYNKHKSLFIAFDFDNTVFDYYNKGDTFYRIESKLREAKQQGHKLILITCREDERLDFAIDYCKKHGYEPDYINENPIIEPGSRKPYYNLFLDDRAGLDSAYETLCFLLYNIDAMKI
jgi:hypothetical protein